MATAQPTPATKEQLRAVLEAERRDLLSLYRSLAPDDWRKMTLCTLWTVRDMLAHLITNDSPFMATLLSGFNTDKANQKLIAGLLHLSNEQLLAEWEKRVMPRGTPAQAPGPYLADDWVHNQDVRWPLNRPRQQDLNRLRLVLPEVLKLNKKRVAGLRLVAVDLGWEMGERGQPLISGNAEALIMGIANRPAARAGLNGAGVEQLFAKK